MVYKRKAMYQTIYDDIVNQILQGKYKVGELLPSEAKLEEQYNVSRTPIRQALKQLENDGYIYRLQGKGSIVANHHPVPGMWSSMTGFQHLYNTEWKRISAKTIELKMVRNEAYAQKLQLDSQAELICLKRIRYFNVQPAFYSEHYLSSELYMEAFTSDLTFVSMVQFLRDRLNIEVIKVFEEIEAVTADQELAKLLNSEVGTPILKVTRLSYTASEKPVELNIYYSRTDRWRYMANFKL